MARLVFTRTTLDPDAPDESQWWTPSTLNASAVHAQDTGTTLWLAPGDYGAITLNAVNSKNLTLRSARLGADRARFIASAQVLSIANLTGSLTFRNIRIKRTSTTGDVPWGIVVNLPASVANVTFDGCDIEGDDGKNTSHPLFVGFPTFHLFEITGSNILIKDCVLKTFRFGVNGLQGTQNVKITGCDISDASEDFIRFSGAEDIEMSFCHVYGARKDPDEGGHPDAFQIYQSAADSSAAASKRIVVFGNIIETGGEFQFFQNIFINAERFRAQPSETEKQNQNIYVAHNYIFGAHLHGVTIGESDGIWVQNNTLVHDIRTIIGSGGTFAATWKPTVLVSTTSSNGVVSGNIAFAVTLQGTDITGTNNQLAQREDDQAANYYGDLFVDFEANTLAGFAAIPSGSIYTNGQGAFRTRPLDPPVGIPDPLPWNE
jgi:hypothetical protein